MSLILSLKTEYPGISIGHDESFDCVLRDDGAGPYIVAWNRAEPKPDEATLLANFDADLYGHRQQWTAQKQARVERDARKILALPDSDDPKILKQKLNAALKLLNVR